MKYIITFLMVVFGTSVYAHEMTPTYPVLESSIYNQVLVTRMEMFNKRQDVEYYEVGVFDKDFNPVPFVTSYKIIKIDYLGRVVFDVYIGKQDANRAHYVCSVSKLRKDSSIRTAINSKICSKFKK